MGPAEALYSAEFFQQCRAALAPGGALVLHIGAPVARPERVAELAQRLNGIFRIVRPYTMYIPLYGAQWAMAVCSDKLDPKSLTADEIDRRIEQRKLQDLQVLQRRNPRGRVRAAQFRARPGQPAAPEAADARPAPGRGAGRREVKRPRPEPFRTSRTVANSWSISAFWMISGGASAMVSPVTRM